MPKHTLLPDVSLISQETPAELVASNPAPAPTQFFRHTEDTVGFFKSVKSGFLRESLTRGTINIYRDNRDIPAQHGFLIGPALKARKEELGELFSVLSSADKARLADIESDDELDFVISRFREDALLSEQAGANGFFPYLIGGIGSAFLDPVSLLTLGPVTKAYTAWRVGSRLGSAGRGALLASVESGLRESILQTAQTSRTVEETIMAIGLGTVLGAGIGAALPGRMLPKTKAEFDSHPLNPDFREGYAETFGSESQRALVEEGRVAAAGGAAVADRGQVVAGSGGGRLLNFVSPLGRAIQRSTDAVRRFGGKTDNASLLAKEAREHEFGIVQRLIETHVVSEDNLKGIKTEQSVERIARGLKDAFIIRTEKVMNAYNEAINDGGLKYRITGQNSIVSRQAFDLEIRRMRLSEANGIEYTPPTDLQLDALHKGQEGFLDALRQGADAEQEFYDGFQKQMIDIGMIKAEDAVSVYIPQVYNREAIAEAQGEFKALLFDHFKTTPDDDWLESIGHIGGWDKLRRTDPGAALEAADEWSVTLLEDANRFAAAAFKEAEDALVEAKLMVRETGKAATQTRKGRLAAALSAARTKTRAFASSIEKQNLQVQELRGLHEALNKHRTALAEQSSLVREGLVPFDKRGPVIIHGLEQNGLRVSRALGRTETSKGPVLPADAKTVDFDAIKWLKAPDEVTQLQYGGQARRLGEIEGATKEVSGRLKRAERKLIDLEEKASYHTLKAEAAEGAFQRAKAMDKVAIKAKQRAGRAAKAAAKRVKAAEGAVAFAGRTISVGEQVDRVMAAMLNNKIMPHGILPDDVVGASGRTKARTINWGDKILSPELEKFMRTDGDSIANAFSEDIAPRIALRRVFGSEDMADVIEDAVEKYNVAITAAGSDLKRANRLRKDSKTFKRDILALRDRELGKFKLPDDPNSAAMYFLENLMGINFLRSMGKVLLASVTDLSIIMFHSNAPFMKTFTGLMQNSGRLVRDIPDQELRALFIGYENMSQYSRVSRAWDIGSDNRSVKGLGQQGTALRATTERVTKTVKGGTALMNKINGMSWWNKRLRINFGAVVTSNMATDFQNFAGIASRKRLAYLRHGIDEAMATRIAKLVKSDSMNVQGTQMPNAQVWIQKDPEAFSAFKRMLGEMMDESIIVPGTGDLPLFMSTGTGRLMMQFQSFSMAAVSRYVRPAIQQHDAHAASTAAISVGLSGMMYAVRMALNGNLDRLDQQFTDMVEKGDTSLLFEAVTRSPLLGHMAMPVEVASRMLAGTINNRIEDLTGMRPLPRTSRLGERNAWQVPLGPSFGTLEGVFSGVQAGLRMLDGEDGDDEGSRFLRKAVRLMPYNQVFYFQGMMNALDVPGFASNLKPDTQ